MSRLGDALPLLLLALAACGMSEPPQPRPATASDAVARTYALAVSTPFAELELPADSRDGRIPPDEIPITHWKAGKNATFSADLPIRSRNLFFHRPAPGMKLLRQDGSEIVHRYYAGGAKAQWTWDIDSLSVHGQALPPAGMKFVYPRAVSREKALNRQWADAPDAATFARATVQAGPASRTGLLLPAPARAGWDVEIPPKAVLSFSPALIEPEVMDGPPSDGATVRVQFTVDDQSRDLWSGELHTDSFTEVEIPLTDLAGQSGRLTIVTEPGETSQFDYVFLADPILASRKATPKRVVLVFVDTLRPDHLSTFGYERETSPALTELATGGTRFANARSIAPWTLPSSRAVLTGRHPEFFDATTTLQGRLAAEGWATAMYAGNLYLSANFDLNREWGLHHVTLLADATEQVDMAIAFLDDNWDRDAMVLVHFMDAHLPYEEPEAYRHMFAGDAPDQLKRERFHRSDVVRARVRAKDKETVQYIKGRYDNNIRRVDDELSRLYDKLGDDDIVVFFSDHGEEFWEHGGYEHGHTLFDEVLRVPLVIRAPGLTRREVSAPVSLIDITPTVLDLLGMSFDGLDGRSLRPLATDAAEEEGFFNRDLAIGRPLYGRERWGVISGDQKYTVHEGRQALFNTATDPVERKNLFQAGVDADQAGEMRGRVTAGLGRPFPEVLRLTASGAKKAPAHPTVAIITVPGGIEAAWVGDDPTRASGASIRIDGDAAIATWVRTLRGGREVYVLPKRPIAEVLAEVSIEATEGETTVTLNRTNKRLTGFDSGPGMLGRQKLETRTLTLGFGAAPVPGDTTQDLSGFDPEISAQLEAMGYLVGDDDDGAKAE